MSIIRVQKNTDYAVIANAPLNDVSLSWEARGVLAYLLTKPDSWEVRTIDLVKRGPAGQWKVERILRELKGGRYLQRKRERQPDGTFLWISTVYEQPYPGNPVVDKPVVEDRGMYQVLTLASTEVLSAPNGAGANGNGNGKDKTPTLQQSVFGAICDWMSLDASGPSKATAANIGRLAAAYIKADESSDRVTLDAQRWYAEDWRGQKGQAPSVAQATDWRAHCRSAAVVSGPPRKADGRPDYASNDYHVWVRDQQRAKEAASAARSTA